MKATGGCQCGAVRYAIDGSVNWQGHCHCESCRRAISAAVSSFIGIEDGNWRWERVAPQVYNSSPGVERTFCATCGSPISYRSDAWPTEMHFHAATLDDTSAFNPAFHVFMAEAVAWRPHEDGLPTHDGTLDEDG